MVSGGLPGWQIRVVHLHSLEEGDGWRAWLAGRFVGFLMGRINAKNQTDDEETDPAKCVTCLQYRRRRRKRRNERRDALLTVPHGYERRQHLAAAHESARRHSRAQASKPLHTIAGAVPVQTIAHPDTPTASPGAAVARGGSARMGPLQASRADIFLGRVGGAQRAC